MQTTSKGPNESSEKTVTSPDHISEVASSSQDQASTEAKIGFLDFPPELRNKIYSNLLEASRRIWFTGERDGINNILVKDESQDSTLYPEILSTCKTISKEAAPILYGANTFDFYSAEFLTEFHRSIGYNRRLLRYIAIGNVYGREDFQIAMKCLKQSNDLKMVDLDIFAIQRFTAEQMAEDVMETVWSAYHSDVIEEDNEENLDCAEPFVDIFRFPCYREAATYEERLGWEPVWGNNGFRYHEQPRKIPWDLDEEDIED